MTWSYKPEVQEKTAEEIVDALSKEEIERRKYCLEKAVYASLEGKRTTGVLIQAADEFYTYIYGGKQSHDE